MTSSASAADPRSRRQCERRRARACEGGPRRHPRRRVWHARRCRSPAAGPPPTPHTPRAPPRSPASVPRTVDGDDANGPRARPAGRRRCVDEPAHPLRRSHDPDGAARANLVAVDAAAAIDGGLPLDEGAADANARPRGPRTVEPAESERRTFVVSETTRTSRRSATRKFGATGPRRTFRRRTGLRSRARLRLRRRARRRRSVLEPVLVAGRGHDERLSARRRSLERVDREGPGASRP